MLGAIAWGTVLVVRNRENDTLVPDDDRRDV